MQRRKTQVLKHLCLTGLFFLLHCLGQTPGFLQLGGAKPVLVVPLLVSVAMLEGELAGALYGVLCGLLLDLGGFTLYGANALLLLVAGCGCGLLSLYWLRPGLKSALLLTGGTASAVYLANYLLLYAMWGLPGRQLQFFGGTLPVILYTTAAAAVVFPAVQRLLEAFGPPPGEGGGPGLTDRRRQILDIP